MGDGHDDGTGHEESEAAEPVDGPSQSVQESGSVNLTGSRGVTVAVTGIINGAIAIVHLPGLPLLLVGLVPPTAVAVIVRADIARDPWPWVLALFAYWVALGALLGLGWLAARRFEQVGPAVDAFLGRSLSRYDHRYRTWILAKSRHTRALPTVGAFIPELDAVFVDVSLSEQASPGQDADGVLGDRTVTAAKRWSLWDLLDTRQPRYLTVLGGPGGGKTTLLRHIARQFARRARLPRRRTVPVLLELQEHAERIVRQPGVTLVDLISDGTRNLPEAAPPLWWETRLRRGKCVVLLDGLDEVVRPKHRSAVARWIGGQITAHSRNHFVLTSRPHAYHPVRVPAAVTLQVRPFTEDQVKAFLGQWYSTMETWNAPQARGRRDTASAAMVKADDLISRLAAAPALHDLMINPLLLTMIANVHRHTGELPDTRAQLYAIVFVVILSPRDVTDPDEARAVATGKREVLGALAFAMMSREVLVLPETEVLAFIGGKEFLADARLNGVLVGQARRYRFAHLTFQEYLAARHIRRHGHTDVLVAGLGSTWWREVTLLWAAPADPDADPDAEPEPDVDPVVEACLRSTDIAVLSLGYQCAEVAKNLSEGLRERMRKFLSDAYRPSADGMHRRLAAGVEALRQLRGIVATPGGTRICYRPATTNLYWLFLHDTDWQLRARARAHPPDAPCDPVPVRPIGDPIVAGAPARGMWSSDALLFVRWVNDVTRRAGDTDTTYRLPTRQELDSLAARGGPTTELLLSATSHVWVASGSADGRPRLWDAPGVESPHGVTGRDLARAVAGDLSGERALAHLLSLGVRARSIVLLRILEDVHRRARRVVAVFHRRVRARLMAHLAHARSQLNDLNRFTPKELGLGIMEVRARRRKLTEAIAELEPLIDRIDDPNYRVDPDWSDEPNWKWAHEASEGVGICVDLAHTLHDELRRADLGGGRIIETPATLARIDSALNRLHQWCAELFRHLDPEVISLADTFRQVQNAKAVLQRACDEAGRIAGKLGEVTDFVRQAPKGPVEPFVTGLAAVDEWQGTPDLDDPASSVAAALAPGVGTAFASGVGRLTARLRGQPRLDEPALRMAFASGLVIATGLTGTGVVAIHLDRAAAEITHLAGQQLASGPTKPFQVDLVRCARPVLHRTRAIDRDSAAKIRMSALALASDVPPAEAAMLRHIAAGTVLMQRRAKGRGNDESIVLAHA